MSNTITFSLSPLSLSSREALHEVLLILCHHLLVNRTLELQTLTDIDSMMFQGITYVRKSCCRMTRAFRMAPHLILL